MKLLTDILKNMPLIKQKPGYRGNYASWQEAQHDSAGYDAAVIFLKVRDALRQVRDGAAVYERDSVLFDKIEYSWPLLSALLWIASREGNHLDVIDFGGSLGSSYFQNRSFLNHLAFFRWNVVEQPGFVDCGREEFANNQLRFFNNISDCLLESPCNVVVFASVLPYVENPYALLDGVIAHGFRYIVIDRTPVIVGNVDRLTVQVVPPEIYSASYPAWFLGEERLLSHLSKNYELMAPFDSLVSMIELGDVIARERGYIFKRKELV